MSIAGVRSAVQYTDQFSSCTELEYVIPEGTASSACLGCIVTMKLKPGSSHVLVDWGDGTIGEGGIEDDGYVSFHASDPPPSNYHQYPGPGNYRIRISDDIEYLQYAGRMPVTALTLAKDYLQGVIQWGTSLAGLEYDPDSPPTSDVLLLARGTGSFQGCGNLTRVAVKPGGFASVGGFCFAYTGLTSVPAILSQATKVGDSIFSYTSIVDLSNLPAYQLVDVTTLRAPYLMEYTFQGVPNPDVSTLPSGIAYLGVGWFRNSGVTDISKIPTSVTHIDIDCFRECTSLRVADLRNVTGLTYLGDSCFQGCTSLGGVGPDGTRGSVALPEMPSTNFILGKYCFADCTSLATTRGILVYPRYSRLDVGVFSGCTGLLEAHCVHWDSPARIPDDMFNGCTSLTNVDVVSQNPNVTAWGSGCFQNIAATSVTIPSGVRDIACNVFGVYSMSESSFGTSSNTHLETIDVRPRSLTAVQNWGSTYSDHLSTPLKYSLDNGVSYPLSWTRGGAPWGASLGTGLGNNPLITKIICSNATVTTSYTNVAMLDLLRMRGTSNERPVFDC